MGIQQTLNGGYAPPAGGGDYAFVDADAEAYSDAIGTLTVTKQEAIDTLVLALKSASLWTKLEAIYPFPGDDANANKFNLKDPQDTDGAFRGTMNGTITHNANGVTGNGSTGYIDTHYNQSTDGAEDNEHVSVYCRTDANGGTVEIGCVDASSHGTRLFTYFDDTFKFFVKSQANTSYSPTVTGRTGYFSLNRTSSAGFRARHNASNSDITQASNVGPQNGNFAILAQNRVGSTVSAHSAKNLAWTAIGQGLTETEDEDLKDIVVAYQTALSRNV